MFCRLRLAVFAYGRRDAYPTWHVHNRRILAHYRPDGEDAPLLSRRGAARTDVDRRSERLPLLRRVARRAGAGNCIPEEPRFLAGRDQDALGLAAGGLAKGGRGSRRAAHDGARATAANNRRPHSPPEKSPPV